MSIPRSIDHQGVIGEIGATHRIDVGAADLRKPLAPADFAFVMQQGPARDRACTTGWTTHFSHQGGCRDRHSLVLHQMGVDSAVRGNAAGAGDENIDLVGCEVDRALAGVQP